MYSFRLNSRALSRSLEVCFGSFGTSNLCLLVFWRRSWCVLSSWGWFTSSPCRSLRRWEVWCLQSTQWRGFRLRLATMPEEQNPAGWALMHHALSLSLLHFAATQSCASEFLGLLSFSVGLSVGLKVLVTERRPDSHPTGCGPMIRFKNFLTISLLWSSFCVLNVTELKGGTLTCLLLVHGDLAQFLCHLLQLLLSRSCWLAGGSYQCEHFFW